MSNQEETALVAVEPAQPPAALGLYGTNDPLEVLERTAQIATKLREVLRSQGLVATIQTKQGPKEYVLVEGWTTLGSMLGVFPVIVWTHPKGEDTWEARCEVRTLAGALVGAAEAMPSRAEGAPWGRNEFSVRAMAQTRAVSRALRQPLGFIVRLAGFEATPHAEMTPEEPSRPAVPARATPAAAVSGRAMRVVRAPGLSAARRELEGHNLDVMKADLRRRIMDSHVRLLRKKPRYGDWTEDDLRDRAQDVANASAQMMWRLNLIELDLAQLQECVRLLGEAEVKAGLTPITTNPEE